MTTIAQTQELLIPGFFYNDYEKNGLRTFYGYGNNKNGDEMKEILGVIKKGTRTKELAKDLNLGDIAVITHKDLDEVAAEQLIKAKVKAVVNCEPSITGRFPNNGPRVLIDNNIPLFDGNSKVFKILEQGEKVKICKSKIITDNFTESLEPITKEYINTKMEYAKKNINKELEKFIDNTLYYAKKENEIILKEILLPKLKLNFKEKHILVVSRGTNYRQDLLTIENYIRDVKPIIIGVDGGADVLLEYGLKPHIIIGDMDSISDRALKTPKCEIIVHAYQNGNAPGMERVNNLGLEAQIMPSPGTSEDAAMLLSYELGAKLIVAVGSHSNLIDFLEKGRKGMASTMLVRMKVGSILVDAKGVNQLYKKESQSFFLASILLASLFPIAITIFKYPPLSSFMKLFIIKLRFMTGI